MFCIFAHKRRFSNFIKKHTFITSKRNVLFQITSKINSFLFQITSKIRLILLQITSKLTLIVPVRIEIGSVIKPGRYLSMSYVMLTIIHSGTDRSYIFLDRRTKEET